ncbi:hypothetical protein BVY01_03605 [bacterium I07]|nr:hypothetical protein BVY01_03605 [bacterium I07]
MASFLRSLKIISFVLSILLLACSTSRTPDHSGVPGSIINYSPASSGHYIGSPSIAVLPDGRYVASHDFFGPKSGFNRSLIFISSDRGQSWEKQAELVGQWWSTLFTHGNALYIFGTSREYGEIVIRRSTDGGLTWTRPVDGKTGLLTPRDGYHCAPVPLALHQGRIWRAFEVSKGERPDWEAMVLSAPVDADLLLRDSWRFSQSFPHPWSKSQWIEGNVVVTPNNDLVNILRTNRAGYDKAAIIHVSPDGKTLSHDREKDIIDFPGGGVKFTIRFDSKTNLYWTLGCRQDNPRAQRNTLVLTSSPDLLKWDVRSTILHHSDQEKHAFQYVDWLFENDDMIIVSRTAYDDGIGGAHNYHDANYMTFHRLKKFRERKVDDAPLNRIPDYTP